MRLRRTGKIVTVGRSASTRSTLPTPFREETLWDGYPEETNAPYGCRQEALRSAARPIDEQYGVDAIHLLPVNLYGPADQLRREDAHVIPDLIRKMTAARQQVTRA